MTTRNKKRVRSKTLTQLHTQTAGGAADYEWWSAIFCVKRKIDLVWIQCKRAVRLVRPKSNTHHTSDQTFSISLSQKKMEKKRKQTL